jgi:hypothetical protein
MFEAGAPETVPRTPSSHRARPRSNPRVSASGEIPRDPATVLPSIAKPMPGASLAPICGSSAARRRDADHSTGQIDERATRVAGVDRRAGLDGRREGDAVALARPRPRQLADDWYLDLSAGGRASATLRWPRSKRVTPSSSTSTARSIRRRIGMDGEGCAAASPADAIMAATVRPVAGSSHHRR